MARSMVFLICCALLTKEKVHQDGNFAIADLLDSEPLFTATINTKARDVIRHVVIPVSYSDGNDMQVVT